MDVALVCDYSSPSSAYDATIFADVLAEAGIRPYMIASSKIYRGVSRYWDSKVTRVISYGKLKKAQEVVFVDDFDSNSGDYSADIMALELATILDTPLTYARWNMENLLEYNQDPGKLIDSRIIDRYRQLISPDDDPSEDTWLFRVNAMKPKIRLFGVDSRSVTYGLAATHARQFQVDYSHCDLSNPKIAVVITTPPTRDYWDENNYIIGAVNALLQDKADFTIFTRKRSWLPSIAKNAITDGRCKYKEIEFMDDIPLFLHSFCGCIEATWKMMSGRNLAIASRVPLLEFNELGFERPLPGKIADYFVGRVKGAVGT